MFNDIRKQRKNLLTYILVGLAGIGMLFLGVPLFNQPSVQFDALKVNGTPIPVSTLQQQITALQRQLPDIDPPSIEKQAIEQLINRTLLEQHALESDYRLSKPALFTLIKNEFGSNDAYQSALRQMHTNASAYENATQRQETSKNYYQFLANSDLAPKALFEQYLNALTQTRNYTLIRLPFETTKESITPTEAQIAEYYQNHSAQYQSKELVDLEYIVLDAANLVSDTITEQTIDEAYEEALKIQSKRSGLYIIFDNPEVAQNIAQAIEQKEKTFKDIYASIENNDIAGEAGELPLSAYGSAPTPIVDDALFNLTNEGDTSPLLDTDYGKMLVLVTTIDNSTLPTREEVATQLQQKHGEELYYDLAAKAFDAALENKPFSQILNLTGINQTKELKQINPQTTNPDWLQDAKVQSQLFGANAIDINQVGEPIELDKHRSIFYRISNRTLPQPLSLTEALSQVTEDLHTQQTEALLQARSNELLKALNDNDDIEPLLAQYQADKQNLALNLYDNQSQLSPQLLQEIFNQSQSTAILKDTNGDNLIIRFNHVTQNSAPAIDEQLQALLYRQWQTDKQFEALEYYAKVLREKANVVIYDENLPSSN